jgi:putative membrane protein
MKELLTTTTLMCALALAGSTLATDTTAAAGQEKADAAKGHSASADATFMQRAAMSSMAEVAHGKQATSNAADAAVNTFGRRMVDDHTKANEELKGLASKKGVSLPTELDQKHQAMQQKLEKMKGAEFDRAYMQHMVQAHKDAVTLFQNEAKNGKDGEARAWAEKTLPTLQEHLKMATEIHAKLGKGK